MSNGVGKHYCIPSGICFLPNCTPEIVCYYYRQLEQQPDRFGLLCNILLCVARTGAQLFCTDDRYAYDTSWNTPVDIESIICPVVVTYHEAEFFSVEIILSSLKSVEGVEEINK